MAEHDGLAFAPIFVKDFDAVFGGDEWHSRYSLNCMTDIDRSLTRQAAQQFDQIHFSLSGLETQLQLGGWRSSADGPLLCPFSLLTGNFTGNFAKLRLRERQRPPVVA